jgi:hypothetical protein
MPHYATCFTRYLLYTYCTVQNKQNKLHHIYYMSVHSIHTLHILHVLLHRCNDCNTCSHCMHCYYMHRAQNVCARRKCLRPALIYTSSRGSGACRKCESKVCAGANISIRTRTLNGSDRGCTQQAMERLSEGVLCSKGSSKPSGGIPVG